MLGRSRGELGIPIVLAEEDDRQLPHGGEVQGLVEGPLRHGSITEERHRDAPVAPELCRRRRAGGDRHARGHDAVGTEDPELRVGDVHGAAPAAVRALILAHQLGEHGGRLQALGQAVAVAAVRRRDDVGRMQWPARADGRRLLPRRQMDETGDFTIAVERRHPLLEASDQQHAPLHLDQVDHREGGGGEVDGHRTCTVLVGTT